MRLPETWGTSPVFRFFRLHRSQRIIFERRLGERRPSCSGGISGNASFLVPSTGIESCLDKQSVHSYREFPSFGVAGPLSNI